MTDTPTPGAERPEDNLPEHDEPGHFRRHHGRGRRRSGPESLTDEPVGTTPEALAEAFLGIGRLLRGRGRFRPERPRREGLTFARGALLAALETEGPQRMGHLAHRLGVVPRTITPMVDALEDSGLVVREDDPDDRRATMLHITDAGRTELTRSRSDRRSTVDEVFTVLSDSERSTLADLLDKLRTAARSGLERDPDEETPDGLLSDEIESLREARGGRRGRGRGPRSERRPRRGEMSHLRSFYRHDAG
jgi:DNA-binding MarR family transcriptional regulator